MFHILTQYQATRAIIKIMSVTRYCMHDSFTIFCVRTDDDFMTLWIRPYAQCDTKNETS